MGSQGGPLVDDIIMTRSQCTRNQSRHITDKELSIVGKYQHRRLLVGNILIFWQSTHSILRHNASVPTHNIMGQTNNRKYW